MTLREMKKKILTLIEESIDDIKTSDSKVLTNDPDIEAKLNNVINIIQYELSRIKKIPDYIEIKVRENQLLKFSDIKDKTTYDVYQIDIIKGIDYEYKAQGTILKCLEDGIAEIEYFRYPKQISDTTDDSFEFDLSDDVLEIMPFGVAADILKGDPSNSYGNIYYQRYQQLIQQLDTRYNTGSITIEGGFTL